MALGRVALLAAAMAVWLPRVAFAEDASDDGRFPVALEYTADPACPGSDVFKGIVVERLGYDPFRQDAPKRVLVRLEPRGRGVEGRVEWRDAAGKWTGDRTFPSRTDDCRELVRAVGFALAVQIQLLTIVNAPPGSSAAVPERGATAAEPPRQRQPPPAANPPPSDSPQTTTVTTAAPFPSPATRRELALGAGAGIGFGLASGPIAIVRVAGAVGWRHASLELGGEVSWPATTRRADAAGFSQQLLLVSAAACGRRAGWSACAVGKGGQIRIAGDIDVPASPSGAVFQTGVRVAVTQRLWGPVHVAAHAEGLVNVTRWTVTLDQMPVWAAPRLAQTLGVDMVMHFP